MKILVFVLLAAPALADTPPVPKMFKGMQGQKGQYQVEVLETGGKPSPQKMTICTDNLMKSDARRETSCKVKLLKDTADEAVVETICPDRSSTVTLKRESANSLLMTVVGTGGRPSPEMKMRYTYLGACREGQGTVTLDKNSEQCQKIRQQLAQMDPAKQCARQKAHREECEQRVNETRKQLAGMCS